MRMETRKGGAGIWKDDVLQRDLKPVSFAKMRELGLEANRKLQVVDKIEDLRDAPPNIIIAESTKNTKFVQNWFKEQTLKKKKSYVMGLGVYQQLHVDRTKRVKLLKPSKIKFSNVYRPYRGQELDDKSILVFRTGGIGDLLFIKPNLDYLKEKYPTCTIKFACGPQYQPMVETWECVDQLLDLPFLADHLISADYHVLFEGVIERCKQAHRDNAYNLFSKWLGLDLPDELLLPRQEPKEELVEECEEILSEWGVEKDNFIVMQLRASSPVRTPRHDFWVKIIDALNDRGYDVLLTDNPRQEENVDQFIEMVKNKEKTFNFCKHSKSIDYTIALTSISKGILATDTALNHIAASMDIPSFGIYGPFPGYIRLKTYPYAKWIDAKRHCAPCFLHGHRPCPQASQDGYSPCYDELIETDELLNELIDKFEELFND